MFQRYSFLYFLMLLSVCPPLSYAQEEQEDFVVTLATENALSPLYLLPLTSEGSDLSSNYLQQLENILAFDLNNNGYTFLAKRQSEITEIGQGGFNQLGSLTSWRDAHVAYVVKGQLQGHSLTARVLDVQKQSMKNIDPLPLTGELANDRKQIHRLADIINKALFGTDGIASTHILFAIKHKNSKDSTKWISEIWEADYDGANARQLTQERSMCVTPTYLPPKPGYTTGAYLYVSYQQGQPKIYLASLKGAPPQQVIYMRGNQIMPAISKQRDKIAFISDLTGNPDLFLQMFDPEKGPIGKPQQIFSAKQATQGSPTFSPDGTRVAFVSNKDGSPKIYIIRIPAPGTSLKAIKATLLSKRNRENGAPAWSPDGTKLAYCAKGSGDRQIWIYDFNTNQEQQLTNSPGNKENPAWAPNGLHLVYNSSDNDSNELFIINLNQQEPVRITAGPGEKRFPSWEPRS